MTRADSLTHTALQATLAASEAVDQAIRALQGEVVDERLACKARVELANAARFLRLQVEALAPKPDPEWKPGKRRGES
jgi:hypothetical protein